MTPSCVEFGERYTDDSGWEKHIEMDARTSNIRVEISGERFRLDFDDAWWLIAAILHGREVLGMDRFTMSGPSEPGAEKP